MFGAIREAFKGISVVFVIVFVIGTLIVLGYLNGAYYEHQKKRSNH